MSKVTIDKCDTCGSLFQDAEAYEKHIRYHEAKKQLEKRFPPVPDEGCNFANGGWSIQRDSTWIAEYKRTVSVMVGKDATGVPFSYGWYRQLDDGGHGLYGAACRETNVCKTCLREWGQPFYANNCDHSGSKDLVQASSTPEGAA